MLQGEVDIVAPGMEFDVGAQTGGSAVSDLRGRRLPTSISNMRQSVSQNGNRERMDEMTIYEHRDHAKSH